MLAYHKFKFLYLFNYLYNYPKNQLGPSNGGVCLNLYSRGVWVLKIAARISRVKAKLILFAEVIAILTQTMRKGNPSTLHRGKLTWHWKANHLKINLLLKMVISHLSCEFSGVYHSILLDPPPFPPPPKKNTGPISWPPGFTENGHVGQKIPELATTTYQQVGPRIQL